MRTQLTTAPTQIALEYNETINFLKMEPTQIPSAEKTLINILRQSAVEVVEKITRRRLLTQSYKGYLDHAPCNELELPFGTLQSVTAIKVYDDSDASVTVDSSNYYVDIISDLGGRIVLRTGGQYPTVERVANGFEVEFVVGYGDKSEDVPRQLIDGMLMLVTNWYENRNFVINTEKEMQRLPFGFDALIGQFIIPKRMDI